MTYAAEIEEQAGDGVEIVGAVIGEFGWGGFHEEAIPDTPEPVFNEVLTWDQARPMLDYEYDSGYGTPECHAVYVWTADHIIYAWQYDGCTGLSKVPRHPVDCKPDMVGG